MSLIEKLSQYNFDYDLAKKDALWLLERYNIPQIGLTHSKNILTEEEKILECTGSIVDRETKEHRFKETDFTEFNELYKSTYLYEMYKSIPNIGRFRIMTMDGPKCYTNHRDFSKRYHFVIETNPSCMFIFTDIDKIFRIPCDHNLYLLDTRLRHTFVNASRERRIHIVMDDLSSLIQSAR